MNWTGYSNSRISDDPPPTYGGAAVPAMEMIQHSVNIMRGALGLHFLLYHRARGAHYPKSLRSFRAA